MSKAAFAEYAAAKLEIIGDVEYVETTQFPNQWGMMSKQYHTAENRYYQDFVYKIDTALETQPEYGRKLAEVIRATTDDFSKLSDYEKYILDRGFEFKTEEELKAGYDRAWKCRHGILLTETEFIIEAGKFYEPVTLKKVYAALVGMVEQKKMQASDIYTYARFKWCLRNPEAIVAYQSERDKWEVNNCGTEVSESEAKEAINSEWGFEKGLVQIIGTPYYDATDYQFIRFDCGHMTWLWKNGDLYQVYAV